MKRILLLLLAAAALGAAAQGDPISGLSARQRYPWNGLVDVSLTLAPGVWRYDLALAATNAATGEALPVATVYPRDGAAGDALRFAPGEAHLVWDAGTDVPESVISNVTFTASAAPVAAPPLYVVVDLSGGSDAESYPVSTLDAAPAGGWSAEYKTTKLALCLIEPGTFTMGSPAGEVGRWDDYEDQHQVTLTKAFYIGVFELTQKQWELVMGSNPSLYTGDARPVECVSYNDIRGSSAGAGWPASDEVDATSFFGRLRARTDYQWDLPTEAQWEYACRAGTTTALNSGKNLTNASGDDANMAEVGRYGCNVSDGKGGYSLHTTVGSYLPNAWGLYDMHGNVWEWCLDRWQSSLGTVATTDPKGASSVSNRVNRGGSIAFLGGRDCRSACRNCHAPSYEHPYLGFRPTMVLPEDE